MPLINNPSPTSHKKPLFWSRKQRPAQEVAELGFIGGNKVEPDELSKPADLTPAEARLSPAEFATEILGIECWPKIQEIFDAVERGERKILVRSCNGAGKTTALAALCNWKLSQFPNSIVLTTASSWTQVTRSLWGEIRKQARYAKLYGKAEIASTQIKLDDKHYALGISPALPENAQGFHAPSMLIAVDEATGVSREIVDALWGNATGSDAQMIMIYNPIDDSSFPFTAEETGKWHVVTISAFDHPNVIHGTELIPGAVTREWIEDRLEAWSYQVDPNELQRTEIEPAVLDEALKQKPKRYRRVAWHGVNGVTYELEEIPEDLEVFYGIEPEEQPVVSCVERQVSRDESQVVEGEPNSELKIQNSELVFLPWNDTYWKKTELVATRICGEWATEGGESYIERSLILKTASVPEERGVKAIGVDVGRSGADRTVIAFFDGNVQLPFEVYQGRNLMQTANRIVELYKQGWTSIALDDSGIGGGVTDRLRELGIPHSPVNFAAKAKGFLKHKEVANARAEMYFLLEEEIRYGKVKMLVTDKEMLQELTAFRIVSDQTTTYRLEDKQSIRSRLGRSPDKADAVALARYGLRLRQILAPRVLFW